MISDETVLPASILAAAVPTLFFVALIYWVDRYEKEPLWLLGATFLWGAIPSIIIAFIFNTVLSIPVYLLVSGPAGDALAGSLIAPPVEETVKGLAILGILLLWRHEIDSVLDGIIYGAMVGMGFAMVENVYYFVNVFNAGGAEAWSVNVFMRAVVFGLNHALFSSMTGLGLAIGRLAKGGFVRLAAPLAGWFAAMFLHFVHNLMVSFNNALCLVALLFDWGGLLLIGLIIIWALRQEREWLRTLLAEEVALGTLTQSQYDSVLSGRARTRARLRTLFTQGPAAYSRAGQFHHRCSKLAYNKHHFAMFGDTKSAGFITQLRDEISALSRQLA